MAKPIIYLKLNHPPIGVVRDRGGQALKRALASMDSVPTKMAGSCHQAQKTVEWNRFLGRFQRGWARWAGTYRLYACGCVRETMLEDFDACRLLGLATGLYAEGVGLASYLMGVLNGVAEIQGDRSLWLPMVSAQIMVAGVTKSLFDRIQTINRESGHPNLDLGCGRKDLHERLAMCQTTLDSLGRLGEHLKQGKHLDLESLQVGVQRRDLEVCAQVAEGCSIFLEDQGVGLSESLVLLRGDEILAIDSLAMHYLDLLGQRVNRDRAGLGLEPIRDKSEVTHEVFRLFLGYEIPYFPSPSREGYFAGPERRRALEQDILLIGQAAGIPSKSLREYILQGHVASVGPKAETLAEIVTVAQRAGTHFRYHLVPVIGAGGSDEGPSGYLIQVTNPFDPRPKGSIEGARLQAVLQATGGQRQRPAVAPLPPATEVPETGVKTKSGNGKRVAKEAPAKAPKPRLARKRTGRSPKS